LQQRFSEQGQFLYLPEFLPASITAQLVAAVEAVGSAVNRNYLPRHKQGGSVSRHELDRSTPFVVAGERLQVSPAGDPHAYALYFYTQPGDHIGWHYDTSYYAGRRYTLLLGVIDESSCRLEYQLHTRDKARESVAGSLQIPPGGLVFFNGDTLRHRITPLAAGEKRVSLTFEYVTDPQMQLWQRFVSNMKDAVAYFGFRQVFGNRVRRTPEHRADARPGRT